MTNRNRSAVVRKIERRVRAKYVKRCWLCFIIALLIGLAGGIYLCKWGPLKNFDLSTPKAAPATEVEAEATAEATEAPAVTAEPTAEPTTAPEPTAAATEEPATATDADAPTTAPTEAPTEAPTKAPEQTAAPTTAPTTAPTEEPESNVTTEAEPEPTEESAAENVAEAETPAPADVATLSLQTDEGNEQSGENAEQNGETGDAAGEQGGESSDAPGEPLGTIENPIPMGEVYEFTTEIVQGGTPRYAASMSEYDTVNLTASVNDFLTPQYFAEKYSTKYKLQGNEAGAALALNLKESTGNQVINPQDALLICFESEDGAINQGYQLMNAEIAGDYGVPLELGEEKTYYKRFAYTSDPEMDFLTMTYYVDGQALKVYFSLEPEAEPEPEATPGPETTVEATTAPEAEATETTYTTIENGSRGDYVKALQERLVELGYLDDVADGIAGPNTAHAISSAQAKAGMEENGVADDAFQKYIFSEDAKKAND